MLIDFARPVLGDEELQGVARALASGWVTMGPEVEAFEREFAAAVGAPHACAVSSCTAALHLALLALGVGAGDEVVTVSHSYVATANAVRYCGAVPVFVDIDPLTFNIDPSLVEAAVTPRTRAILCVHQMGMPCDVPVLRRFGLPIIEDAACAVGSEILVDGAWQRIGRPLGDVACFSFHPRKLLTTGDGGMLTTASPDLDRAFRQLRQHGMDVAPRERHLSPSVVYETHEILGYNYRMSDVQAAIGRAQLARLDGMVARRRQLAERYRELLPSRVVCPQEPPWARSNWQSYCVRLPDGCEQRAVMQAMLDRGVPTRRAIMCCHLEPAYAGQTWRAPGELRHSEEAQRRCVLLPLHPAMTSDDQALVAACLAEAVHA